MKTEPIDSNSWARLARQIELANAARNAPNQVPSEPVPSDPAGADGTPSIGAIDVADILPSESLFGSDVEPTGSIGGVRSHLAWGIGGFFLGAVCWYFIGFWAFIGSLVFSGPEHVTTVERNVAEPAQPRVLSYVKTQPTTSTVNSSRHCTAFHRDPGTDFAVPTKCQTIVRALGGSNTSKR